MWINREIRKRQLLIFGFVNLLLSRHVRHAMLRMLALTIPFLGIVVPYIWGSLESGICFIHRDRVFVEREKNSTEN